jgi:hypothetical protein
MREINIPEAIRISFLDLMNFIEVAMTLVIEKLEISPSRSGRLFFIF